MRKFTSIVAAAALSLPLSACSSPKETPEPKPPANTSAVEVSPEEAEFRTITKEDMAAAEEVVQGFFDRRAVAEDSKIDKIDRQLEFMVGRESHPDYAKVDPLDDTPAGIVETNVQLKINGSTAYEHMGEWEPPTVAVDFRALTLRVQYPVKNGKVDTSAKYKESWVDWKGVANVVKDADGRWLISSIDLADVKKGDGSPLDALGAARADKKK